MAAAEARINEQIRATSVRLIGPDGEQEGVKSLPDALQFARGHDLDLVEVAPNADPPVCRVMDHSKHKYEQDMQRKESRRKTVNVVVKEMKFRPKIDAHDYSTKTKHVERFLAEGSKVKVTIMFRGREMAHPELGMKILDRIAEQVVDIGVVEMIPKIDGRNMTMVLAPTKRPAVKVPRVAKPTASAEAAAVTGTAPAPGPVTAEPVPEAAGTVESAPEPATTTAS